MLNKPIRAAFIGGGINSAVGHVHQIALHMDRRFQLVAGAFSLESDVNADTAAAYAIPPDQVFADWRELITNARQTFDVAVVLTPTPSHAEIVTTCLEQKIPVVCEKALCVDTREARSVQQVVARTGEFLAVTYNYTGYPMLRELRARIRSGQLGCVQQIHVEMPQEGFIRRHPATGATAIPQSWRQADGIVSTVALDLGVHLHHLVDFLSGERPLQVSAVESHFGAITDVVDNTTCMAKYSNGMVCSMWFGKTALGCRNGLRVRVFGTQGSAEWVQMDPEHLDICDSHGARKRIDRSDPENTIASLSRYDRFKVGHPAGFIEAFANYYADIADCLQSSHRNPARSEYVAGVDVAVASLQFLEAVSLAAKSSTWVDVDSV